jgi:hypothetical protein
MRSMVIQLVTGLTIVVAEIPMRQVHRNLPYETRWWLRYVAQMCNLLAPYYVLYIDANSCIQDLSFFDDPHHLSAREVVHLKQRLGILLGPSTVDLSSQSTAYQEGSARL